MTKKRKVYFDEDGFRLDIRNPDMDERVIIQTIVDLLNYGFNFEESDLATFTRDLYLGVGSIEKVGGRYVNKGPQKLDVEKLRKIKRIKVHEKNPKK